MLIVGAGLFVRTFSSLAHVRLGFEPDPILIVNVDAKRSTVDAGGARRRSTSGSAEAAAAVPGVRSAALQNITPLTNSQWDTLIENPPGMSLPESERDVYMNEVSAGYFATYGTPIVAGRDFTAQDTQTAPLVVIVNETFAKKYFPGQAAIGQRIRNDPSPGRHAAVSRDRRRRARRGLRFAARQHSADRLRARAAERRRRARASPSRSAPRRARRRC